MPKPKANALQAVLDRTAVQEPAPAEEQQEVEPEAATPAPRMSTAGQGAKTAGKTVLIGGHFPPEVARQLALVAAEEGVKKNELLAEALDLLFVKKGKSRIKDL